MKKTEKDGEVRWTSERQQRKVEGYGVREKKTGGKEMEREKERREERRGTKRQGGLMEKHFCHQG